MNELNRIFQSNDVNRLRLVDLIEDGGERRGLATPRRASDEDEAGFLFCHFFEKRRQMQRFNRRHGSLEDAQHHGKVSLLPENTDAKACLFVERIAAIA